jgi:hypothetical protein
MRYLAVLYIALASGAIALAQQPTEWRPNIAEDNKAATWDDTIAFVSDTVNHNRPKFLITAPGGHLYDAVWLTAHAEKGDSCHLEIDFFESAFWGRKYEHTHESVDLKGVDPLSVTVGPFIFKASPNHLEHGFVIRLSGTNSKNMVDRKLWDYHDMFAWSTDISPTATLFTCDTKPKNCKQREEQTSNTEIWASDQESAKRVARALMHAAILCGGAKAVSPF